VTMRGVPFRAMTAKEKLRRLVEDLSEQEAEAALVAIERERDPMLELLDRAPVDDEPRSDDEEAGVREAKADAERGEVFSAEQIRRELG
jgi:hypothetical protein